MFSILVCSINASFFENLKINIRQTIGCEFELLVWDNLAEQKPITEVEFQNIHREQGENAFRRGDSRGLRRGKRRGLLLID